MGRTVFLAHRMSATHRASSESPRDAALSLLRRSSRFLLVGHERPDGDCLGSQAGLARVLASLGKEVRVLNPDPIEAHFEHLAPGLEFEVYAGGALPPHDVAVTLDFAELERCGSLGPALANSPSKKVVVDHHIFDGEPWWDAAYVDRRASATGLLVWRIARELGAELDLAAAEAIFTALVTDTGWFRHPNTDAETLRAAAELVERGVVPARIHRAVFQRRPPAYPLLLGRLLRSAEYHAEGRLALMCVDRAAVDDAVSMDGDEALDLLRTVETVEVVLFLREVEARVWRLSARSKTDYDVNVLARGFGGGGHRQASGATLQGGRAEVLSALLSRTLEGFEHVGSAGREAAG